MAADPMSPEVVVGRADLARALTVGIAIVALLFVFARLAVALGVRF